MRFYKDTFHANQRCFCEQFLKQQQRHRRRRYRVQTNTELQTNVGMIITVVDGDGGSDNHNRTALVRPSSINDEISDASS